MFCGNQAMALSYRFLFLSFIVPSSSMQYQGLSTSTIDVSQMPAAGAEDVQWRLCNAEVHSNLGGLGPDTGDQELRFKSVFDMDGTPVDLVITNMSEYKSVSPSKNGVTGCFANINVVSPSSVFLSYRFVKGGTQELVDFDGKFSYFTVYDIDESRNGVKEQITFNTPVSTYWLTKNHTLERTEDDGVTFASTVIGYITDNPEDPDTLTPLQQNRAVMVDYVNISEYAITFEAFADEEDARLGGRNFLFAGHSFLGDDPDVIDCIGSSCDIWADPHVSGFDNAAKGPVSLIGGFTTSFDRQPVDVNAYETGDFWLVKSADVHIQARYALSNEFDGGRSAVGAVAIGGPFIGSTLIVEPKSGVVKWDGVHLDENSKHKLGKAGAPIFVETYYNAIHEGGTAPSGVDVSLPLGLSLKIQRYNTHLDLKIKATRRLGDIDGQCGNFNGNPQDDTLEHINRRMHDMTVAQEHSLFNS